MAEKNSTPIEKGMQMTSKIEEQITSLNSRKNKLLTMIKESIKSGGSSGDIITDAVTYWFGRWDREAKAPFEYLQNKVQQMEGTPILVLKKQISQEDLLHNISIPYSQQGFIPPIKFELMSYTFQYGQISGDLEFDVPDRSITIPTKKHLTLEGKATTRTCPSGEWKVQEGSIKNNLMELPHLYTPNPNLQLAYALALNLIPQTFQQTSEIYFFDEISKFSHNLSGGEEFYKKAKNLLGQIDPPVDPPK